MSNDCQVFLQKGLSVNECVVENEDGSYTIFINDTLCEAKRMKAFLHALSHIENRDFDKFDVQEIEFEAHNTMLFNGDGGAG